MTALPRRAMRATTVLLLLLPPALLAQQPPPRLMYIYRDSLKCGVDSAYRAIEDEGAQIFVVTAYAANRPLSEALSAVGKRKEPFIGTPIQGFAIYRPDLSRGGAWRLAGTGCTDLRCAPELEHARA
jgi:hypothetical protein